MKDRGAFDVEVVSFKVRDRTLSDFMTQQPGYLFGFPARNWNRTSAVLDRTISLEDICRWVAGSYEALVSLVVGYAAQEASEPSAKPEFIPVSYIKYRQILKINLTHTASGSRRGPRFFFCFTQERRYSDQQRTHPISLQEPLRRKYRKLGHHISRL